MESMKKISSMAKGRKRGLAVRANMKTVKVAFVK